MKRICIYILPIISGLLLAACNNGEVNNKYCNLRARLTIDNVLQAPVLFTACESMGEYCTIKSDGQRFTFTNASNNAKCNSCGRNYNLNECGTIADGPGGRNLYRYRVSYIGNTLVINNGI